MSLFNARRQGTGRQVLFSKANGPCIVQVGEDVMPGVRRLYMFPSREVYVDFIFNQLAADVMFDFLSLRVDVDLELERIAKELRK